MARMITNGEVSGLIRVNNFAAMKTFHESLDTKGIKHRWEVKPGAHEWKVWRESLYELAPLLFQGL